MVFVWKIRFCGVTLLTWKVHDFCLIHALLKREKITRKVTNRAGLWCVALWLLKAHGERCQGHLLVNCFNKRFFLLVAVLAASHFHRQSAVGGYWRWESTPPPGGVTGCLRPCFPCPPLYGAIPKIEIDTCIWLYCPGPELHRGVNWGNGASFHPLALLTFLLFKWPDVRQAAARLCSRPWELGPLSGLSAGNLDKILVPWKEICFSPLFTSTWHDRGQEGLIWLNLASL